MINNNLEVQVTNTEMLDPSPYAYLDPSVLRHPWFSSLTETFSNRRLRLEINKLRWDVFKEKGLALRFAPSQAECIVHDTIPYNIKGIENSIGSLESLERSEVLFRPLMSIDRVYAYQGLSVFPDQRILLIGSRTEYEVLLCLGYGFQFSNISAVDLISYSPWITPGDMHALPFPDNSFDIIIMGWVLTYSLDPWAAAREVARVSKPRAIVSIGTDSHLVEHTRKGDLEDKRPRSTKNILNFFGNSAGQVYFKNEPAYPQDRFPLESNPTCEGHVVVAFEISK